MIKLFASDLDGTLLNIDHQSDETIRSGLKKLQDAGFAAATATGRSKNLIPWKELPGMYHVCMNGAVVLDPNLDIIASFPIDPEIIKDLYESCRHLPVEYHGLEQMMVTISQDEMMPLRPNDAFFKAHANFFSRTIYNADLKTLVENPIYKINVHHPKGRRVSQVDEWVQRHPDQVVDAPCHESLSEITALGVNKAKGIEALGNALKISKDQIAVFGDGGNDLDMLAAFENSYCPSGGMPEAKKTARYEIGPFEEYSVIQKMLELANLESPKKKP